jgi:hypothetical protein
MGEDVRTRLKIDADVKRAFKSRCQRFSVDMATQIQDLMLTWVRSDDFKLINAAKMLAQESRSNLVEMRVDIDESVKAQFLAKCTEEDINGMSVMVEVLCANWIN